MVFPRTQLPCGSWAAAVRNHLPPREFRLGLDEPSYRRRDCKILALAWTRSFLPISQPWSIGREEKTGAGRRYKAETHVCGAAASDVATVNYMANYFPLSVPALTGATYTALQGMNSVNGLTLNIDPFVTNPAVPS